MADTNRVVRIEISRAVFERAMNFVSAHKKSMPWLTFAGIVNLALESMVVQYEVLNQGAPFPVREDSLRAGRPTPALACAVREEDGIQ